jgi:REP element-mobilizing transposase RayT
MPSNGAVNVLRFFDPRDDLHIHERHLPHWEQKQVPVFVTWHLADSLPASLIGPWRIARDAWRRQHPPPWSPETASEYRRRFGVEIEEWLDAGHGSCRLRDASLRQLVETVLRARDSTDYRLMAWVIMPNHVHVLFARAPGMTIDRIIKAWKGVSARSINRARGGRGTVWHEEYWDRLVRNEEHLSRIREYIANNPVRAKLSSGDYSLWIG